MSYLTRQIDRDMAFLKKAYDRAVSYIYSEYFPILYRYGMKFSVDNFLWKDTIQDLFVDLIKNRETLGDYDNIFLSVKIFSTKIAAKNE